MQVSSFLWRPRQGCAPPAADAAAIDLVLYFGPRGLLEDGALHRDLGAAYPGAILMGCSSGGQIVDSDVSDEAVACTALRFERTRLKSAGAPIAQASQSQAVGAQLARRLDAPGLAAILVLSDGLAVNGSELIAGLSGALAREIPICGGMAGDGAAFARTLVGLDGPPQPGYVAALGFYGEAVRIGHGSNGGWEVFGPSRVVTRSSGAVLEELDGRPALDLYTRYLDRADIDGLPGTALLFPLLIRNPERPTQELVRTILSIDRASGAMTFAGDMPKGWSAQLMRGSIASLTAGAEMAGAQATHGLAPSPEARSGGLALMVSCIGRRLAMGQNTGAEIEAVQSQLPPGFVAAGFYSYGEFSPHARTGCCELHNQTMTVMTLTERAA
ncbi:MAG: FIST C-terminal domain-containing protein [Methylobacteriaceae bacterium]|nr:FIST C-terminal domain-containing protein [Methylobacteriaceae bacterium]